MNAPYPVPYFIAIMRTQPAQQMAEMWLRKMLFYKPEEKTTFGEQWWKTNKKIKKINMDKGEKRVKMYKEYLSQIDSVISM